MDLNPTYGAQEFVESLSHGSGGGGGKKSPSSGSGSKNKSSSNSSSRSGGNRGVEGGNKSGGALSSSKGGSGSAYVDEAYRRLGQRLSLQAHGDMVPREPPVVAQMGATRAGAFQPYHEGAQRKRQVDQQQQQRLGNSYNEAQGELQSHGNQQASGRSLKVAKATYSDHGDHTKRIRSDSLLRKLTFEAKQTFRLWEQAMTMDHKKSETASADAKLSPQRYAFSQLSIEGGGGGSIGGGSEGSSHTSSSSRHGSSRSTGEQLGLTWTEQRASSHRVMGGMGKGLLSAVLEVHSDSNTSASGPAAASTRHSPGSQSISTKGSTALSSHGANSCGNNGNGYGSSSQYRSGGYGGTGGSSVHSSAPVGAATTAAAVVARGKCLTNPSQPFANDGMDNLDGNLIVFENDLIVVPRKGLHSIKPQPPARRATEFRVQALLGQGTFAQVFQCMLTTTGEVVAVKIVKNKPAYTRQATIEIDVFRALMQQQQPKQDEESKQQRSSSSVVSGNAGGGTAATTTSGSSGGSSRSVSPLDYMVNLICYFMHRSHLCLVFELLGLNLYEVLKRRQFRGLPLTVVRSIVLQSVEGVKELSQKGIVHCDLKPENILFASEEAVRHVVNAGYATATTNTNTTSDRTEAAGLLRGPQQHKKPPEVSANETSGGSDESRGNSWEGDQSSGSSSNAQTILMGNVASTIDVPIRSTKLIDFGSACFEGYTSHTYIQSRFYRSPEVLVGLPYDSAIDMWSLGCVTAELFLGLPILPGVHEHDQLCRITEMITKVPDWMLDQGSKSSKYFIKYVSRPSSGKSPENLDMDEGSSGGSGHSPKSGAPSRTSTAPPQTQWRLKTLREYIVSLSQNDIKKKGGLSKLETQPGNRYFRRTKLPDILALHSQNLQGEEQELVPAFIHFLYGLLDPDPWKRWTAFQAMHHPFLTGSLHQLKRKTERDQFDPKDNNHANVTLGYYWKPPWDPAICRRKLLNVQKMREKQQAMRRNLTVGRPTTPRGSHDRLGNVSPSLQSAGPSHSHVSGSIQSSSRGRDQSMDSQRSSSSQPQGGGRSRMIPSSSPSQSDLGSPRRQAQNAIGSPATSVGFPNTPTEFQTLGSARSFNEAGYIPGSGVVNQGDLGIALQRPGVVPATGDSVHSNHSSYSSNQSMGSSHYMIDRSIPHSVYHEQQHKQQQPMNPPGSMPQVGSAFALPNIASSYGSGADPSNLMHSDQSVTSLNLDRQGRQFVPTPSSATSSVTMEGQASLTLRFPPTSMSGLVQQQQQQQYPYLPDSQQYYPQSNERITGDVLAQQQPQFFPGMLQGGYTQPPLQQTAMFQSQFSNFQAVSGQMQQAQAPQQPSQTQPLSQLQHPHQYSIPQQPVIVAQSNAPGGGFYYVATSATGQPIILQPVGLLNQPQAGQPQQQQPMQQQYLDANTPLQQATIMMQGQQMMMPQQPFQQQQTYGQFQQHQPQQPLMMGQQYVLQQPQQEPMQTTTQQYQQQPQQQQQQQGGLYGSTQIHDQQQHRRYQQSSSRRSNQRNQRRMYGSGGSIGGTSM